MADFVNSLDPSKLVVGETLLAFLLSPFNAPIYNFPLFLFGIYAQENSDAVQSLQLFSVLLPISGVFDIYWLASHEQGVLVKLLHILLLVLKLPTFVAFAGALRSRGAQFSGIAGLGGIVWSMPGGFTSGGREGYQTVDDEPRAPPARPPPGPPQQSQQAPPGAYQSV
ncbi:hypothetical protein K488DRAFT_48225 [Vararia minispora EC-137]|uniref:Uncharacterized protein n=1 Tax=Vararia minispora EC-137 TaxID=1314806 RepID=A0ACB8QNC1_9AGAM|nr:hypothetical protein K488DRAFT_48225 [Vararia minispora EC-137]